MADQKTIENYISRIVYTLTDEDVPAVNARIIAAQAQHETANFSSNVLKVNNNAFGMKKPSVRKSPYVLGAGSAAPADEGPTPYARYKNVEDSARDLVHWLKYNHADYGTIKTPETYAAFLKSEGYYGPTSEFYGRQIRIFYEKTKDLIIRNPGKTALLIVGLSLIGAGVYLYIKQKAA